MKRILHNIHWLFWGCIPFFWIYGFLIAKYDIDINIHDTMLIVGAKYISLLLSLIFFITGLGYYLSYKSEKFKPLHILTIIHAALIFAGLALAFFVPKYHFELPANEVVDVMRNHNKSKLYDSIFQYGLFSIFIAQPIFLLNLIISIFRK